MVKTSSTPTVVTHVSGVKFSIGIRSHEILVDQTLKGGGTDSAPTPLELLGASLGSCIAYYIHHFFHTRGLPADGISVSVSHRSTTNPTRIEGFEVQVALPADVPPQYMPLLQRVIDACPAHNTLVSGAKVAVTFLEPSPERALVSA
ncbi:MAG TPA: OsmC family protein [Gemmatimonadaceae bacterium]